MRHAWFALVLLGYCVASYGMSPTLRAQARPIEPYVDPGVCPFECCQYGAWVVRTAVRVYDRQDEARVPRFRLRPGDSVYADTGNVILRRVGVVQVRAPIPAWVKGDTVLGRLRPRDTVYVLSPIGEGWYRLWYRGRIGEAPGFWDRDNLEGDEPAFGRLLRAPQLTWWAHVRTRTGRAGWIIPPTLKVDGIDSCA